MAAKIGTEPSKVIGVTDDESTNVGDNDNVSETHLLGDVFFMLETSLTNASGLFGIPDDLLYDENE